VYFDFTVARKHSFITREIKMPRNVILPKKTAKFSYNKVFLETNLRHKVSFNLQARAHLKMLVAISRVHNIKIFYNSTHIS